jgi:hypothetical protein
MLGLLYILGFSFLLTVFVAIIHINRDGWHSAYGRGERLNVMFTAVLLVVYGAFMLGSN